MVLPVLLVDREAQLLPRVVSQAALDGRLEVEGVLCVFRELLAKEEDALHKVSRSAHAQVFGNPLQLRWAVELHRQTTVRMAP